jgi:hypothetical protein
MPDGTGDPDPVPGGATASGAPATGASVEGTAGAASVVTGEVMRIPIAAPSSAVLAATMPLNPALIFVFSHVL